MDVSPTTCEGVLLLRPARFRDLRGQFSEVWNSDRMRAAGLDIDFVQDNHSLSEATGTVRGLHLQTPPAAQTKLVWVPVGAILDVAVDVRHGSPTYGKWHAERLSSENGAQLLIPAGFLHGFLTLEPNTHVMYKVDAHYSPAHERAVSFDDPDLAIAWDIDADTALLSEKDRAAGSFLELDAHFEYEAAP